MRSIGRHMPAPESEFETTAELVAQLVREQHPRMSGDVELVGRGWDCDLYRLGADRAVRLPRRSGGVTSLLNEQRWLPTVAAELPIPIPVPLAVGRAGAGYPWGWSIIPWFEGIPADMVSAASRDFAAARLGEVVAALHSPAPADAPTSSYRGVPLGDRDSIVRRALSRLAEAEPALRIWDAAVGAPPNPVSSWTHGDLHPGNVLLHGDGQDGRLAAVIDFGDMSGGDPAVDLAAAWLFFSPEGRNRFRAAAGRRRYDPHAWTRARGWAVDISIGLMTESDGSERMTSLGRSGLLAVLSDS